MISRLVSLRAFLPHIKSGGRLLHYIFLAIGPYSFVKTLILGFAGRLSMLVAFVISIKCLVGLLQGTVNLYGIRFDSDDGFAGLVVPVAIPILFWLAGVIRLVSDRSRFRLVIQLEQFSRIQHTEHISDGVGVASLKKWLIGDDLELRSKSEALFSSVLESVEIVLLIAFLLVALFFFDPILASSVLILMVFGFLFGVRKANRSIVKLDNEARDQTASYTKRRQDLESFKDSDGRIIREKVKEFVNTDYGPQCDAVRMDKKLGAKSASPLMHGITGVFFAFLYYQFRYSPDPMENLPNLVILLFLLRFMSSLVQGVGSSISRFLRVRRLVDVVVGKCGSFG